MCNVQVEGSTKKTVYGFQKYVYLKQIPEWWFFSIIDTKAERYCHLSFLIDTLSNICNTEYITIFQSVLVISQYKYDILVHETEANLRITKIS